MKNNLKTFLISLIVIVVGVLFIHIGKQMLTTELPKFYDWLIIIDGSLTTLVGILYSLFRIADDVDNEDMEDKPYEYMD